MSEGRSPKPAGPRYSGPELERDRSMSTMYNCLKGLKGITGQRTLLQGTPSSHPPPEYRTRVHESGTRGKYSIIFPPDLGSGVRRRLPKVTLVDVLGRLVRQLEHYNASVCVGAAREANDDANAALRVAHVDDP